MPAWRNVLRRRHHKAARGAAAPQQSLCGGHREGTHRWVEILPVLPVIKIVGPLGDRGFSMGMIFRFRLRRA